MKKYSEKHRKFLLKKSRIAKSRKHLPKGKNTKQYRAYRLLHRVYRDKIKFWDNERRKFYLEFYKPIEYVDAQNKIVINRPIGAEVDINYLAQSGSNLLGMSSSDIEINLRECSRVWPSAIMTFCSFKQWLDLTAMDGVRSPRVSSTDSDYDDVTSYLDFSGFHHYVSRRKSGKKHTYVDEKIVKIQRESGGQAFEDRYDEIAELVGSHSGFNSDELEYFKSAILTEILINVTEHGINYRDMGWYTLAQVHPASGFISVNIADNGIGISNSLKTGPQKVKLESDEDHIYILEAFKPDISGAFSASTEKKGLFIKKYEKGQRRGNGLRWICEVCAELNIQLTLISGKGFVQYDGKGNCIAQGTYGFPIFAGTLYSLVIPIRKENI